MIDHANNAVENVNGGVETPLGEGVPHLPEAEAKVGPLLQVEPNPVLGWIFMTCGHVKNCVNLVTWFLIGCSFLCSQSGASLLVDPNLDNDYNS